MADHDESIVAMDERRLLGRLAVRFEKEKSGAEFRDLVRAHRDEIGTNPKRQAIEFDVDVTALHARILALANVHHDETRRLSVE